MSKFNVGDMITTSQYPESLRDKILEVVAINEDSSYSILCKTSYGTFWALIPDYIEKKDTFNLGVKTCFIEKLAESKQNKRSLTLPTDSNERKQYPILSGCIKYFPAALAGVALISKLGNDKHNPGEALHHARGKSMDHGDCIIRHLIDTEDLIASKNRGGSVTQEQILAEANSLVWRALAYSQALHEHFGAPLAPAAKESKEG